MQHQTWGMSVWWVSNVWCLERILERKEEYWRVLFICIVFFIERLTYFYLQAWCGFPAVERPLKSKHFKSLFFFFYKRGLNITSKLKVPLQSSLIHCKSPQWSFQPIHVLHHERKATRRPKTKKKENVHQNVYLKCWVMKIIVAFKQLKTRIARTKLNQFINQKVLNS